MFFLLHASVIDLLEVTLFAEFIVGRSRLLCNDARLVKLFLQRGELVGKFGVAPVDFWDGR